MVAHATLGGLTLRTSLDDIRWNFKMKVSDKKALGGKVIQILGTSVTDLTVTGSFGSGDRKKGDTAGWEEQERFRQQIKTWARNTEGTLTPLRFTFPPRGWDFRVFIKAYSAPGRPFAVRQAVDEVNPKWQLTLFVVDDGARKVITGIRDLYVKRLMEGVGWKQTTYNGPTDTQSIEDILGPLSPREYLAQQAEAAYNGSGTFAGVAGNVDDFFGGAL